MLRLAFSRSVAVARVASLVRAPAFSARLVQQQTRRYSTESPGDGGRKSSGDVEALRRDWDAPVITYEELKPKTTQPSSDKYLIDVREPDEVLQGSIPSAVNLPLSQLPGAFHLPPPDFKAKFGFEKPRPHQELTFYCRSGARSTTASDVAKRNGFTNLSILNYKGSWLEWTEREGKKPAA
ncbi:hypothetical protein GSI_08215 [Ganoderma sinense ZZ0214-1]|uniref:Rhodanese domain-containing protein n=1 Tax=Ganoderma sinense ZZ0214-1 TaxID=1077348 RepID=A0A2G8S727_9APHY|nr:hypothetical protein GSI_08215 [Ganoderma sinense ZZ0214-1]